MSDDKKQDKRDEQEQDEESSDKKADTPLRRLSDRGRTFDAPGKEKRG